MVKPVAIYADVGTSEVGVASLLMAVERHLGRKALPINALDICAGKLAAFSALIVPGGADLPYCEQLNGEGNRAIREFVESGGLYVGICAGAYYGCREIAFIGADYNVFGTRELGFFPGLAKGCLPELTGGRFYDETVKSKAIVPLAFATGETADFYYHGGCYFEPASGQNSEIFYEPLAFYPNGSLAVVSGKIGQGNYLLSGVHFELQAEAYHRYVLEKNTDLAQKCEEYQFSCLFQAEYGAPIWQAVQKRLK